jgi:magnesium and cobalt exporter, CNNM family
VSAPHAGEAALDLAGVVWRLGATLFFVVLNGFFVATEFGLVKVRAARIQELARDGGKPARRVKHILEHLDLYLSSCQLGITLASLALGALGEPAVSRLLLAGAGAVGLEVDAASRWVPFVSIALAFSIITVLHMTVGEQAPKMWALRRPEQVALGASLTLRVFTFVLRPFIVVINALSNWMLRIAGLPSGEHGHEAVPTVEELRSILSLSARAGHLTEKGYEIAQNVFRMTELEVRHIMMPRVDAEFLSLADDPTEQLEAVRRSSHSRFPVCESDLDSIIGFVHGKDILEALLTGGAVDLRALAREPLFVPDTMALSNLLREMQTSKVHLAAVMDEHGTVVGLAFREDALEEIVGPLGDEFDEEVPEFREVSAGVWEVRGSIAFPDLCAKLDINADDEGEETAAGYVTAHLGRFPVEGDTAKLGSYELRVEELSRRRITRMRISR